MKHLLVAALVACGGSSRSTTPSPVPIPTRARTAGDAALAHLPPGADVIVEIDLARARANPTIGSAVTAWLENPAQLAGVIAEPPPVARATWIVLAAYDVGTPDAITVTLLHATTTIEGAVALSDNVFALAPPAWIDKMRDASRGANASTESELLILRARAMPSAAEGAVLRATARLDTDARIALAGIVPVDPAPRALSAWLDVADDLALVIDADAEDPGDRGAAKRSLASLKALVQRIAAMNEVTALGLAPPIAKTRIERTGGSWVRTVTVVPPGRLVWAAKALATRSP
jgi:hypothetical protein